MSNLERPSAHVVDRTDPASVTDCPHGGSIVSSGFDDDHNGVLDDAEIEKRTIVCDDGPAEPPPAIVVRLLPESAGANCGLGGTAVQSGPDRNRNGRLDDDEVARVDYACGEVLLTRLTTEPAGARCVAGGVAVLIGRDRNADRLLGDDEVEETEVECGTELSRDVMLQSAEEVAALANIALISGSLTVAGSGLAEIVLPRLVQVRGALEVTSNAQLARIAMPALQSVDGRLALALNEQLTALELPELHRVDRLEVDGNAALEDLSGVAGLTDVIHGMQISGNDSLALANLPLAHVGGDVTFDGNAQLVRVLWLVTGAEALRITSNPALTSVEITSGVGSTLGALTISSNAQLATIVVNTSQIGEVRLEDNTGLAEVAVDAFRIDGDVVLRGNGPMKLALAGFPNFGLTVRGAVHIEGGLDTLDLLTPLRVAGDFALHATGIRSLGRQNTFLDIAGSVALIDNPHLAASVRILVGGGVEVRDNAALSKLAFLVQDQIDGDLTVTGNAVLAEAPSLEALRRVRGNVRIASNPVLKAAFGPPLEQVDGRLAFDGNAQLDDLGISRLVRADSLSVAHCGAMTALELTALTEVASIEVRGNGELRHLGMPVLQSADLGVFDNPHLPACEITALFAALGGEHHQSGNDETAVCP